MKAAAILSLFAMTLTAGSNPVRRDITGNPLLGESTKRNLVNAASRFADGDHRRAQAYAGLAALPGDLTVFINTESYDVERAAQLSEWAREGIAAWNDTYVVSISECTDRSNAAVVIEFKDSLRRGSHAGFLTSHRLARYGAYGVAVEVSARIEVANRMPYGRLMNRAQVRKVVMHELGHLLGLDDSRDSDHMMGPVSSNPRIEPVDSESIAALLEMDSQARSFIGASTTVAETRQYVPKVFEFAR